ncbi:MAG: hypothetical protein A2Z24_01710 [Candidatus Woykebacteria bacterium RBG_16_44_10]|uniref:Uncharacterized protein n=1 Tax=Candidatus Woykebacteria bacterium RBG_16_44_10 TaxID=1802597 RepID=A0A1G1WD47_9BACT|nr:MAG: hypothetical protein A2Z24_01710 [Candidatus Woykebacteria bacterium RBG_16_44_10]
MTRQKTIVFTFLLSLGAMLILANPVFAQGMMGDNMLGNEDVAVSATSDHTAIEEAEGKALWEKFQAKELNCEDLSDEEFASLGEYFMGQMAGDRHEAMNNMMIQMMGEEDEKQMHAALGKRLSGCDASAAFPQNGIGFMPMMQMMTGGGGFNMMGSYGMMGGWFGIYAVLALLTWVLVIIALVLGIFWLWKQIQKGK